jgi:hypothetical protein
LSKVSQKTAALPNCMPQFPLTGVGGVDPPPLDDPPPVDVPPPATVTDAEQLAVLPPLDPPQLHVHGPAPATDEAVPLEHRLAEGMDDAVVPLADPHTPATGAAPTATVVLAAGDVPPLPVQVSVYVVVLAGDAARIPLMAFGPLHPPEAVHAVALVEDQVTVDIFPATTLAGDAEMVTVGNCGIGVEFTAA